MRLLSGCVGIDQDPETVETVRRHFGPAVDAQVGSLKLFLGKGADGLGKFHFIYVSGLFDYLSDRLAVRLTAGLFDRLLPGGKLWIANFAKDIFHAGYMEAFMDWWLTFRSPEDMLKL